MSWLFFVVPEHDLPPDQKTIGLNVIRDMVAGSCSFTDLAAAIDAVREQF